MARKPHYLNKNDNLEKSRRNFSLVFSGLLDVIWVIRVKGWPPPFKKNKTKKNRSTSTQNCESRFTSHRSRYFFFF